MVKNAFPEGFCVKFYQGKSIFFYYEQQSHEIDMIKRSPAEMSIIFEIMTIPFDIFRNKLFTNEN